MRHGTQEASLADEGVVDLRSMGSGPCASYRQSGRVTSDGLGLMISSALNTCPAKRPTKRFWA